ncbi:hypothetical protein V8D89_011525 [Ganoderma adspersum]
MGTLCFLSPSIREFNVQVRSVSPEGRWKFREAFAACFSSVQDLEVISLDTLVPVLDIGSLPQLHPRLRRLIFQPFIDSDDISHLASLHNLEHLSVKLRLPTLPVQLLGLRSLAVSSYTSNGISAFVADMDAPQLQSFSMSQLYGNPEEIHRELSDVLRVLVTKCPSLTAFSWKSDQRTGRGERSDALADLIAPLLSIRTIRNFSAYLRGYMVSHTPSSIRAFAEAWPDLEVFDLRTADVEDDGDDNDNVPYADLESLVSFARHCPRLQRLYIPRVKFDRDAAAAVVRPPAPHWLHSLDVAEVVLCGEQDEDAAAGGDLFRSLMHEVFPAAGIEL